jgi:hypothetical protein
MASISSVGAFTVVMTVELRVINNRFPTLIMVGIRFLLRRLNAPVRQRLSNGAASRHHVLQLQIEYFLDIEPELTENCVAVSIEPWRRTHLCRLLLELHGWGDKQ